MYQVFVASSSSQQVPRSYCCTKRVTPLESSHGHHLPTRAASAHAARGRCFDPKRAATAPRCRACSASPEHRVGSLSMVGQDQTQARGARRQLLTMAHTSTASSAPDAVPRVPGGGPGECGLRFSLCTQQLNWCAVDELSFSGLCHEYCCCLTCYPTPGVFTLNRSFYPSTSAAPPVSFLILHPREIQILWSQTAVRQRKTNAKDSR